MVFATLQHQETTRKCYFDLGDQFDSRVDADCITAFSLDRRTEDVCANGSLNDATHRA